MVDDEGASGGDGAQVNAQAGEEGLFPHLGAASGAEYADERAGDSRDLEAEDEPKDLKTERHDSLHDDHETLLVVTKKEGEDDGSDVDALPEDFLGFQGEIASLRHAMEHAGADDADVLDGIRGWGNRVGGRAVVEYGESSPIAQLIPVVPTNEPDQSARGEEHHATCQVVAVEGGTYRGEVHLITIPSAGTDEPAPEQTRAVPHGWGILTATNGVRRIGQWIDGGQTEVGTLQSAAFNYDGQWIDSSPSGYGSGTFGFGCIFSGCWYNGRPYGLGSLQRPFEANGILTVQQFHGWFIGIKCLQSVSVVDPEKDVRYALDRLLPPFNFPEQPSRGLFSVGVTLEYSRLSSFRRAFDQWRKLVCEQAVEHARRCRDGARRSWITAHIAQEKAIIAHLERRQAECKEENQSLVHQVAALRDKQDRIRRIRKFHTDKYDAAIFQRALAERCVLAQQDSIDLLESELSEVSSLLRQAHDAEADCRDYSQQIHLVKRQIENTCVKINALRCQLRVHAESRIQSMQDFCASQTPRLGQPDNPGSQRDQIKEAAYVCDVPGCSCGIPRDVFLRVAAVLNGD